MGRISESAKERIRERTDMVQLVGEYVSLQQRGPDDYWGRCPFHEEKRASFHIRPSRGLFKCFGCGKGGDVFRFVEEVEGLNFADSLRRLAGRAGVELESASPEERARDERRAALLRGSALAASFFEEVLWSRSPEGERGRRYLEGRGIEAEAARTFGLGVAPRGWNELGDFARRRGIPAEVLLELGLVRVKDGGGSPYDFFRDRLMFPIRDEQGKVVGLGGRTLSDDPRKYMNSREVPGFYEKRKVLYGLDRAKLGRPKRLVVVEGYLDVVVPHQAGRTEFVAALGTAFTPEQARLARRYVDEVVLLFDADEAGSQATLRALANLMGEKGLSVKVARLPDGLDPDDAVRNQPDALAASLEQADDLVTYIIDQSLRGYELSSPAGQERAVRAAIRLLARVPDRIALSTQLNLVARRFGLPETVLRQELTEADLHNRQAGQQARDRPSPTRRGAARASGPTANAFTDLELCLLEALLAVPGAVAELRGIGADPEAFSPGPAQTLAGAIFAENEDGPTDPARIMGRIEDPPARDLCARLIGRIHEAKDYRRELEGFPLLLRRNNEKRLAQLLREIQRAGDQETKTRLLAEHRELHARLQVGPTVMRAP